MNPSAATVPASPRGSAGTKRKASSGSGSGSGVGGSGGKRPKKGDEGGSVGTVKTTRSEAGKPVNAKKGSKAGKAGDYNKTSPAKANTKKNKMADGGGKSSGAGKQRKDGKTAAASSKKHGSSGGGENVASGKEAAARGKLSSLKPKGKAKADKILTPKKNGASATGIKNNQGGKNAEKHAIRNSGLSPLNSGGGSTKEESGNIKSRQGMPSGGAGNGHRKKKTSSDGGSGGGASGRSSTKTAEKKGREDEKKKTKKPRTGPSIKPVVIAPPVVVQREVPEHHVISNRRAAVLARTFAKETKEAQKDFEEAVAAAERSRVVREQRLKASSSPRGLRHSPPPQGAASAATVKPTGGAGGATGGPIAVVSAASATPALPVKGGGRWPELGFGGQPWGLGPFYRQEEFEGRDASASSGSTRDRNSSLSTPPPSRSFSSGGGVFGPTRWIRPGEQPESRFSQAHLEENFEDVELEEVSGSGSGRVPKGVEPAAAEAAAVVSGVPARPRRAPKEMRRARVGAGEALDLGEEATFREWLARLRSVQVCRGNRGAKRAFWRLRLVSVWR